MAKAKKKKEKKDEFVGMKKAAAIKAIQGQGKTARVMGEDGQNFVGTCDFQPDRVNLIIEKDIVKSTYTG